MLSEENETKIKGFENEELSCSKFTEKVGKDIIDYKFEYENNQKIIDELQKENEEKDKRINDLEFVLLDMVMQFANRVKTKGSNYALDTKGLSTLELAFNELGFDEMYPVKKANEKYKILEKKYYYEN